MCDSMVFSIRPTYRVRAGGFSLMEVMATMVIFAIGIVAVASVIPAASYLQKQTIDDVISLQVARNAKAMIHALPFTYGGDGVRDLEPFNFYGGNNYLVNPMPGKIRKHWEPVPVRRELLWPVADRSYPVARAEITDREAYWVPLIQDRNGDENDPDWRVIVFILKHNHEKYFYGEDYGAVNSGVWANPAEEMAAKRTIFKKANDEDRMPPEGYSWVPLVANVPVGEDFSNQKFRFDNRQFTDQTSEGEADQVQAGDQILDSNGVIYTEIEADREGASVSGQINEFPKPPRRIWYGRPAHAGALSPTLRIVIVGNSVIPG